MKKMLLLTCMFIMTALTISCDSYDSEIITNERVIKTKTDVTTANAVPTLSIMYNTVTTPTPAIVATVVDEYNNVYRVDCHTPYQNPTGEAIVVRNGVKYLVQWSPRPFRPNGDDTIFGYSQGTAPNGAIRHYRIYRVPASYDCGSIMN